MAFSLRSMRGNKKSMAMAVAVADAVTWYCALALVVLVLVSSLRDVPQPGTAAVVTRGKRPIVSRPCEEIYVVGEGETLHTISDKCGDPYIVERNPHIHDPDDVFPGLVIKLNPSRPN